LSLRSIRDRVKWWFERRRARGESVAGLVFVELPAKLVAKAVDGARQVANRALTTIHGGSYVQRIREVLGEGAGDAPLVLVAVPGILHYIVPCLSLVQGRSVVVVANGLASWEERILADRFPGVSTVRLKTVGRSMLSHGVVLDLLLRNAGRRFTLLDPDLFLFDPDALDRLVPDGEEIAVGGFGFVNPATSLEFPTTHLLSLDVPAIRDVMERQGIGATIYFETPPHLVELLAGVGLGDHNVVKEHVGYYDPINLIFAVALAEGRRFRVLGLGDEAAIHVGGVTYGERTAVLDYLSARLLELPCAASFAERYRALLGVSTADTKARLALAPEAVDWADRIVARLAAACTEA
jgi:hypothetical protein